MSSREIIVNLTNDEAVAYSQSYLKELERQSAVRFAERRSFEEGKEKGRKEGIEKALVELSTRAKSLGLSQETMLKLFGGPI